MTLSGIIYTKNSKSPGKPREVRGWTSVRKQGKPNTFKNTPENDLDTFCDIISHLTSKYRPDFLGLRKLLDQTGPDRTLTNTIKY
jgi:hypothetical protein